VSEKRKFEEYAQLGGINSKASQYATGIHEFLGMVNLNFRRPGALSKRDGSTFYIGATIQGRVHSGYEFERLNGVSHIVAAANTNLYSVSSAWTSIKSGIKADSLFDFQTFVDRMFACNGDEHIIWDGVGTPYKYDTPRPVSGFTFGTNGAGPLNGTYKVTYGYVTERGYFAPGASPITRVMSGGATGAYTLTGLTLPSGFGISQLAFYRTEANGSVLSLLATTGFTTSFTDAGATALSSQLLPSYFALTLSPRYLSLFNNAMFMSGYSGLLSTMFFSEVGEPQGIRPEYFFEVRTNDGDRVVGHTPYSGGLVVFKERSFHQVSGDNPNNYSLTEISDQYGCVGNRASVVWNDVLWFLDSKGIVQFNGANYSIVSAKVEPIFVRMNLQAARENATAVHDKINNQVKFSFPVDGATKNNMTVVYDYLVDAWTTELGYEPSVAFMAKGTQSVNTEFYGGYTGTLHNFNASLRGDNGRGMTALMLTRFLADMGNSVTKQFRRLFIDTVPVGTSSLLNVNFFQDYGASVVLTRTTVQSPFQNRIDYGIQAKALSVEIAHTSDTENMQVNGYTIEYTPQRRV